MKKEIYINLAVRNLEKSKVFFKELGFTFNEQFSNEKGACMVIAEGSIHVMLLDEEFFRTFTQKTVINAHEQVEALITLACESEKEVDELVAKAVAAGGKAPRPPEDYGFMYTHGFEDLDGHNWGVGYMRGNPG
jgi:predicted lactoylglutathione lyase